MSTKLGRRRPKAYVRAAEAEEAGWLPKSPERLLQVLAGAQFKEDRQIFRQLNRWMQRVLTKVRSDLRAAGKDPTVREDLEMAAQVGNEVYNLVANAAGIQAQFVLMQFNDCAMKMMGEIQKYCMKAMEVGSDKDKSDALNRMENHLDRFIEYTKTLGKLGEANVFAPKQTGNIVNFTGGGTAGGGESDVGLVGSLRRMGAFGPVQDQGPELKKVGSTCHEQRPGKDRGGDVSSGDGGPSDQDCGSEESQKGGQHGDPGVEPASGEGA